MKMEVSGFERLIADHNKVLKGIDIVTSKISMVMEGYVTPDLVMIQKELDSSREKIETDMFNVGKLTRSGQEKDQEIVETLKAIYENFVEGHKKALVAENLLKKDDSFIEVIKEHKKDQLNAPEITV